MNMEKAALRPATQEDTGFAFDVKKAALGEYVRETCGWDEDERTLLTLEGRQLIVRAGKAAHDGVARLLAELWTEATRRIVIEGSANFTILPRAEQVIITDDARLFTFYQG